MISTDLCWELEWKNLSHSQKGLLLFLLTNCSGNATSAAKNSVVLSALLVTEVGILGPGQWICEYLLLSASKPILCQHNGKSSCYSFSPPIWLLVSLTKAYPLTNKDNKIMENVDKCAVMTALLLISSPGQCDWSCPAIGSGSESNETKCEEMIGE